MFNRLFRRRGGQGGGGRGGLGQGGSGGGIGRGGGNKPGSGPAGSCVCSQCGNRIPHQVGQRCIDLACPKCGAKMIRE